MKFMEMVMLIVEERKKLRRKAFNKRKKSDTTFTQTGVTQRKKSEGLPVKNRKARVTNKPQFKIRDSRKAGLQIGRNDD